MGGADHGRGPGCLVRQRGGDRPAPGTYVEFTLEPTGAGTRLRVVETGFAQLPEDAYRAAYDSNTKGWASELGELADYLDAA